MRNTTRNSDRQASHRTDTPSQQQAFRHTETPSQQHKSRRTKRRKNHVLSLILILLIILVIAVGAITLMHLAGQKQNSDSADSTAQESTTQDDTAQDGTAQDDAAQDVNAENTSAQDGDAEDSNAQDSTAVDDSSASPAEESSSIPEPEPTVMITIPDRSTFPEILEILSEASGTAVEELSAQADELTVLLPDSAAAQTCYFPLEGYILSGTYELPEEEPLLESLLKASLDRITGIAVSETYTVHEILSMASIAEIESSRGGLSEHYPEQMPHIASVIYNRLNSGMQLQMDVTFQYGYNTLQPNGADDSILTQYNTYDAPALPIGPICSPSEDAVKAVMNPESSDDLFFVFDENGNYYYAYDYNEHLDNCVKAGIR